MSDTATSRLRRLFPNSFLLLVALVATLSSNPGQVPADTKLSLYLNPLRLISDSIWTWDHRLFSGWVPHQNVGYLWPTGPFYALFDALGSPDWVAHRLWIATLMALAGVGTLRLSRLLGLTTSSSLVAGAAYQFSPYVLPYISRTSALLLPWSLLPWLILLTIRYARTRRLRDLMLFGLVIASSGGLNATALLMIAPGPLIWLVHLHKHENMSSKQLMRTAISLSGVAVGVSAWWLAGLFVQGRYGAAVLSYSEALVSTTATSTAPEVLRGLGYWLFYDRGPVAPLTSASTPYQESVLLIVVSGALVILSILGISKSISWRRPLSIMLLTGVVLAVGAHPFSDPNLLFRPLVSNPKDALSLALRSSTRAIPLVVLALAIGLGCLIETRLSWNRESALSRFRGILRPGLVFGLLLINLPAALNGDLTDRVLLRPEVLPDAWTEAGEYLDQRFEAGHTGSVLVVPGIESAAYRWGYPVDPILPAITRKPLLTRDWLPLGSPAVMDLLYALDDSFQNGTPDPDAIAPVARMLGADTVMFVGSHQYERFGTLRPSRAAAFFDPVPRGLSYLTSFGEPTINTEPISGRVRTWTEEYIDHPDIALPEITLFAVENPGGTARQFDRRLLVAADGSGLVEAAANGLLTGRELAISEASLDAVHLDEMNAMDDTYVVTDSNRRRAHHWRSSQNVWGATEPPIGTSSVRDDFDSRLPVHPEQDQSSQTIVEAAPIEATATTYGAALRYLPEYRPRMAVDGDPHTAWRITPDNLVIGQILSIHANTPLNELLLRQPLDSQNSKWISNVSIRVDHGKWVRYELDEPTASAPENRIELGKSGRTIDLRIEGVAKGEHPDLSRGVGFSEVVTRQLATPEIVRLPNRLAADRPSSVVYSLSRQRSDPYDRRREDPERSLIRRLPYSTTLGDGFSAKVRLESRAPDRILMNALGVESGASTQRVSGSASWWGPAALDGDDSTAWWSPVDETEVDRSGAVTVDLTETMKWFEIDQPDTDRASRITRVSLTFFSEGIEIESTEIDLPDVDSGDPPRVIVPEVVADSMMLSILEVEEREFLDLDTRLARVAPAGISELRSNAWVNAARRDTFETSCREDLITIDDEPVSIRLSGRIDSTLRGEAVKVELCSDSDRPIREDSLLVATPGVETGWAIDHLTIGYRLRGERNGIDLPVHTSRAEVVATTTACATKCWVELPFGSSSGWRASSNGVDLGSSMRSAAGRGLWQIGPSVDGLELTASWAPQRYMWWGLGISSVVLVSLLALTLIEWMSKRRKESTGSRSQVGILVESRSQGNRKRSTSGKVVASSLALVVGALVVTPSWGILIAAALLLIPRPILVKASLFALALGYFFVVIQQIRYGTRAGFHWPSAFERAHRPTLAVLILFTFALQSSKHIASRMPE